MFAESLGACFRLPGGIVLAYIPREARRAVHDAFHRWVTSPITEMFHGRSGHPKLFPTGFVTSVKPLVITSAGNEFILPLWTHLSTGPEDPELWAYWMKTLCGIGCATRR